MEPYFKIGEISKLYNIGVDSLRYYEKLGIITPQRSESGYRLYRIDDIWRLNVIRDLRELDFSMEDIRLYLEDHSVESTIILLEEELQAIRQKMLSLEKFQENVEQRLRTIHLAKSKPLEQVELAEYPVRRRFSIPGGYESEEEMDVLIKRLLNINKERFYVIGNNQIGSAISLADSRRGEYRRYKSVFIMDKTGEETIEGGSYLTVSYRGACDQNTVFIPRLFAYAKKHHLQLTGEILELLWVDIHISADIKEHITELQVRVDAV